MVRLPAAAQRRLLGGALIGLERQWRSRGAGLRTNTLVAAGAAMFLLISHMTPSGSNPTQVTAYVVSGVGFLGAGVIIFDGARVRGINTAATLWCAAAVGALAASGLVWQAGVATASILAINILLRPIGRRIDRQPVDEDTEVETVYHLHATTRDKNEAHVRALLLQAVAGHGYQLCALRSADIDGTDRVKSTPNWQSSAATTNKSKRPPPTRARAERYLRPLAGRRARQQPQPQPGVTPQPWCSISDIARADIVRRPRR